MKRGEFTGWTKEQVGLRMKDAEQRLLDAQIAYRDWFSPADVEARVAAAVAAERERAVRVADEVFARWGRPEYGLLRGDVEAAIRGAKRSPTFSATPTSSLVSVWSFRRSAGDSLPASSSEQAGHSSSSPRRRGCSHE